MKTILLMIILLSFSGCYEKIVYVEPKIYPFEIAKVPEDKKFPIRNDYVEAYKAWKAEMYGTIDVLNSQIETYLELNKDESNDSKRRVQEKN